MELQIDRPDPTRPTVRSASWALDLWSVRGYDRGGELHVDSVFGLPEAHAIATEWATNGYPEADA